MRALPMLARCWARSREHTELALDHLRSANTHVDKGKPGRGRGDRELRLSRNLRLWSPNIQVNHDNDGEDTQVELAPQALLSFGINVGKCPQSPALWRYRNRGGILDCNRGKQRQLSVRGSLRRESRETAGDRIGRGVIATHRSSGHSSPAPACSESVPSPVCRRMRARTCSWMQ